MDDNLQRTQEGKPIRTKQHRARTYYGAQAAHGQPQHGKRRF